MRSETRPSSVPRVGEQAPDLDVLDEAGRPVVLSAVAGGAPLLVMAFRGPADDASLQLLMAYRDSTLAFHRAGVRLCAVGKEEPGRLAYLRRERGLGFPVLADPDGTALSRWGMLGATGLVLLDRSFQVRERAEADRHPDEMLSFIRRGGIRAEPRTVNGIRLFWQTLQHALRPRRLVR